MNITGISFDRLLLAVGLCVCLGCGAPSDPKPADRSAAADSLPVGGYLALDLVSGSSEELPSAPPGGWSAADRTDRIVLRRLLPGTFSMGAAGDPRSLIQDESPVHRVSLTRGYCLGVFEITRGQWAVLMGESARGRRGEAMPADDLTRIDCQRFLAALGRRFPQFTFTLPTEAEWEYAARAGQPYGGETATPDTAWFGGNSDGGPHAVGTLRPNAWGLHDMCGNVWEWCQDAAGVYPSAETVDPLALPETDGSSLFIARGGSWRNAPNVCTTVRRGMFAADIQGIPLGLRVACQSRR